MVAEPGRIELLVHVVTYESADTVAQCLRSLLALDSFRSGENVRIIVTDNASSDRSAEIVERAFAPLVELRRESTNTGFAAAHNSIFREAVEGRIPFVLIVNPDAVLTPSSARMMVDAVREHPRVGLVTPKILRTDDSLTPLIPRQLDAAGMFVTPSFRHFDRGSAAIDSGQFELPQYVFGGTGAVCLFRLEFLEDVAHRVSGRTEIFDEHFFAFREDADLAWRAQALGWQCLYEPRAVAYHRRTVTPERRRQLLPRLNALGVQNRFLLQMKHLVPHQQLFLLPAVLFRNLLVLGAVATVERTSRRGLVAAWQARSVMREKRREIASRRRVPPRVVNRWFRASPVSEPALRREAPSKPVESLTAIYINYNSGSRLRNSLSRLLQTLADTLPENRWKVVVWDNASGDGSADDLPCGPRLIVRHSEENVGFAAAIQNATAISPGDAYLILNPDVTIEGHSINTLIDRLNAYGNCGAVSPLLIDTAGAPQFGFSIRALPTIGQMLKEAFGIARILEWFGFSRSRLEDDPIFRDALLRQVRSAPPYYSADQIVEGAQPAAACVLIRAEAFNELGGFDSGFRPAWFEDVDFFARMSRSRWCAALDPSVSAVHEGGYSLSTLSPTEFIGIFYKNMLRYWSKHGTTTERRVARIALPFAAWCRICITFVLREKFKKNNLNREHQTFVGAVRAATRTAWEMFRYRPSLHLSQTGTTYGEAESVNTRASA